MRLVSYIHNGSEGWGVVRGPAAAPVVVDLRVLAPTLKDAITSGVLAQAAKAPEGPGVPLSEVTLLPPVVLPEKVVCIGVNYANRNAEYKDGSEAPKYPSVFVRWPDSLTGHDRPLVRPPESEQLDYEGEIVVVIGKGGRRIPRAEAYAHIAGLTIMNEGSIRDWLRHAKFNVTQGKNFTHSGSCGPWMVTADEFTPAQYENMHVTTRVNGEVRQNDTTASMMFPIAYLIEYVSTFCLLKPGDIIATGTPNGAGARFTPPRWLKPGDVVEVEVEGVGLLRNGIVDEK
ncbi:MAG: fumarylacetoacetate hydrolase family protein [Steroidobacteraceae bacterium]